MIEEIKVNNVSVTYEKSGAHIAISTVKVDGLNFSEVIVNGFGSIKASIGPARPDISQIQFPAEYESVIQSVFTAVDQVYRNKKACLAAFLSSYIFERFTPLWNSLLQEGRHVWAIQLWQKLIFITHQWEEGNQKHIHKGSPYAFLAFTYLLVGDVDTGFSYIYNAIEDDIELNKVCPELNYPFEAPVYRTASLSSNLANIMAALVMEIRSELEKYIKEYQSIFNSNLSIEEFDKLFLQNPALETVKYYFVFNYWAVFEFKRKVEKRMMQNDFSKLKNADWFFALCLVIDKLLHSHPQYTADSIGPQIEKYSALKGFMSKIDFNTLKDRERVPRGVFDVVIPKLLPMTLQFN